MYAVIFHIMANKSHHNKYHIKYSKTRNDLHKRNFIFRNYLLPLIENECKVFYIFATRQQE